MVSGDGLGRRLHGLVAQRVGADAVLWRLDGALVAPWWRLGALVAQLCACVALLSCTTVLHYFAHFHGGCMECQRYRNFGMKGFNSYPGSPWLKRLNRGFEECSERLNRGFGE